MNKQPQPVQNKVPTEAEIQELIDKMFRDIKPFDGKLPKMPS